MEIKICLPLLLLLAALSRSQSSHHRSYDWRTPGSNLQDWPKITSLLPYAATESYPAIHDPYYPDASGPYSQEDSASYSQEYSEPYHEIPQSLSSYENYHDSSRELNMTLARIGGFAGSGDTKGFGAYDFPKDHHRQPVHHDSVMDHPAIRGHPEPVMDPEIEELMRISSDRQHRRQGHRSRDRVLVHPLPPPL